MKLGTNLKYGQKMCREQESSLHLNFNKIMPFEVFSLKIVSTVSFLKTVKDVDLCFTSRKPFKSIHEILYKYIASSDDVQRKRAITLHSVLTEWCPFVLYRSFSDYLP